MYFVGKYRCREVYERRIDYIEESVNIDQIRWHRSLKLSLYFDETRKKVLTLRTFYCELYNIFATGKIISRDITSSHTT